MMLELKGHVRGNVVVLDEPLALKENQAVTVLVPVEKDTPTDFTKWLGMANRYPRNPNPKFNSDDDLWEKR